MNKQQTIIADSQITPVGIEIIRMRVDGVFLEQGIPAIGIAEIDSQPVALHGFDSLILIAVHFVSCDDGQILDAVIVEVA